MPRGRESPFGSAPAQCARVLRNVREQGGPRTRINYVCLIVLRRDCPCGTCGATSLSGLRVEAAAVRQRRAYAYRQSFGSCGLLAAVDISRQSWCGFSPQAESAVVALARRRVRIRARLHFPQRGGQSCDAAEGASGKNVRTLPE